jgi:hypothetical protein
MFFLADPEFTRNGYYLINGIKTFSKIEAWQLSGKNWSNVEFIFNDDTLSQLDWTVEPNEDIYELYRQRAQQLREKYDYLVLMYSGGIDSETVLETFLFNNIKLDEVFSLSTADTAEKSSKYNKEIFEKVFPYINSLDLNKSGTYFRYLEFGKYMVDQWNDEFHYENFQNYSHGAQWFIIRSHILKSKIKDHEILSEQGKKICYIWGFEKPSIYVDSGRHYYTFVDLNHEMSSRQYINREILKERFNNFYDETFYISNDMPKIFLKQSHLLLNLINNISKDDPKLKTFDQLLSGGPFVEHHAGKYLDKKTIDGCIFPKAILSRYSDEKKLKGSTVLSQNDNWFLISNHENKDRYIDKIKSFIKDNKDYYIYTNKENIIFFNNEKYQNYIPMKTRPIRSKPYFLTKDRINDRN